MHLAKLALAAAVFAAGPAAAQDDLSSVEIKAEKLAPGVAVLFGAGGNIGLSYGEDGNVIVDDQFAPLTDKIAAAIAAVTGNREILADDRLRNRPLVRFVINTHWHFDHTGGNENFGKRGAVIVAHDNVRARMSSDQLIAALNAKIPASAHDALPVVTFADEVTLHLNGDTIHVVHVARAHTDGDALIHWQKANVLHMGDTFFNRESFPFIDLSSGGSIDGIIAAADRGLGLADSGTRIIPGHGPLATRADLVAYRAMLADVRARVAAGLAAKRTLAQIQAAKPAARYGMPDGFIKPDQFVEFVYRSLTQPRPSHDLKPPHAH